MKTFFCLIALLLLCLTSMGSTNTTLVGATVSVNGTNTSSSVIAGTYPLPGATFYLQVPTLNNTNDAGVRLQWCTDNATWVTVTTNYPTATNAGVYVFTVPVLTRTNYFRAQVVTTNAQSVGLTLVQ